MLDPEFEQGVPAEVIGVIGVGISRGDLIDALGEELLHGMFRIGRMSLVTHRRGQALREADLSVDTA